MEDGGGSIREVHVRRSLRTRADRRTPDASSTLAAQAEAVGVGRGWQIASARAPARAGMLALAALLVLLFAASLRLLSKEK